MLKVTDRDSYMKVLKDKGSEFGFGTNYNEVPNVHFMYDPSISRDDWEARVATCSKVSDVEYVYMVRSEYLTK